LARSLKGPFVGADPRGAAFGEEEEEKEDAVVSGEEARPGSPAGTTRITTINNVDVSQRDDERTA